MAITTNIMKLLKIKSACFVSHAEKRFFINEFVKKSKKTLLPEVFESIH